MTTKLTLTIEDRVIKNAKKYAKKKGRSLSGIIENYLKTLGTEDALTTEMTARVRRLHGSVKLPADFDYKNALTESISKKHDK